MMELHPVDCQMPLRTYTHLKSGALCIKATGSSPNSPSALLMIPELGLVNRITMPHTTMVEIKWGA